MALRDKHEDDSSHACAEQALAKMQMLGIPPEAENYTIWFNYSRGSYPALNERLDALIDSGERFTEARNREIYDSFFGDGNQQDTVRESTAKLFGVIKDLVRELSLTGQQAGAYDGTLERLQQQIAAAEVPELAELLGEVKAETNLMVERNRSIAVQFDDASREIVKLQDSVEAATRQSEMDELTGLANWRCFHAGLRALAVAALETNRPMAVVMFDLDDFRDFNERNGRWVGDQQLRFVADVVARLSPEAAVAARYGGEEFAVILPEAALADAVLFAEAVRREVGSGQLVARKTGQKFGVVTLSAGASEYRDGEALGGLMQRCTQLLGDAKRAGRDQVAADPTPVAKAS